MEIWTSLDKNYKVSDLGNIYSVRSNINLKPHKNKGGYLRLNLKLNGSDKPKTYRVHQLVAIGFLNHKLDGTSDIVVDHINNIKDDNRLCNLRLVTTRFNLSRRGGSSKYVGVSKFRNKWMATIRIDGKLEYLGLHETEKEAHDAYVKRLTEI